MPPSSRRLEQPSQSRAATDEYERSASRFDNRLLPCPLPTAFPGASPPMSDPADRSQQERGQARRSSRRRRRRRPTEPFYLSPTLKWPLFDPECCQECGHTIPLHETGWILEENILCADCFIVLDEQRTQREAILHPQPSAPTTPPLAASHFEPSFQLTEPPPFHPHCFAATIFAPASPNRPQSDADHSMPLFERTQPQFELTAPPPYHPRRCFAAAMLPADERTESSTNDSLPLFENVEPAFELTEPPPFAPRANFAGLALATQQEEDRATQGDVLTLFELFSTRPSSVGKIESEPEFFEPIWIEDIVQDASPADVSAIKPVATEAPRIIEESAPLPLVAQVIEAAVTAQAPAQVIATSSDSSPDSTAATDGTGSPPPATDLAMTLEPSPIAPTEPSMSAAADATPMAEAKPQVVRRKSRPQKSWPTRLSPAPPPPPLVFQHPVDALLDDLHRQQVDAKVARALHQARALDPFFAEVDAMLAVAGTLRDRWMTRGESGKTHRSQTG